MVGFLTEDGSRWKLGSSLIHWFTTVLVLLDYIDSRRSLGSSQNLWVANEKVLRSYYGSLSKYGYSRSGWLTQLLWFFSTKMVYADNMVLLY